MVKFFYQMIKHFPKEYKYSIGDEILRLSWNCLDLVVEVNACHDNDKKFVLRELNHNFEKLKVRIRMSQEIDLISIGQFSHIEENFMLEIGKMIGGWQKWAR